MHRKASVSILILKDAPRDEQGQVLVGSAREGTLLSYSLKDLDFLWTHSEQLTPAELVSCPSNM